MRLRSERIVTPSGVVPGVVSVADGVIDCVSDHCPPGEPLLDLGDRWILPGYIDVHVHGGGGAQCNTSDLEEVLAVARFHASHGTTALVATTVAAPVDELLTAVRTIASVVGRRDGAAAVLGSHLEGPFLSRARPGAMDPRFFLDPDTSVASALLEAGGGTVRIVTLAPELPGSLGLVHRLLARGVVVSVGHSDGDYGDVEAAVRAGAAGATHLFNAMPPLHHRSPGVVGAVLDLAEVSCELICDGVHVDPVALRLALRCKGVEAVRLVTDAMQAAGMPDGIYRVGTASVEVRDGRALIAESGSIAGSTLTMDAAVRNAVRWLGVSVAEASVMASVNPARLLGVADRKGALVAGMDADLVILDDDLCACATMVEGRWVSEAPV
jgi:N-acetylglucosamine-6-phosphate deacetylase